MFRKHRKCHLWERRALENVLVRGTSQRDKDFYVTLLLHVALDVKLLVTYLKILLRKDHEMIHEAAEKNCQTFFASKGKNVLRNSLQIASSRVIRLIKGRSYV